MYSMVIFGYAFDNVVLSFRKIIKSQTPTKLIKPIQETEINIY